MMILIKIMEWKCANWFNYKEMLLVVWEHSFLVFVFFAVVWRMWSFWWRNNVMHYLYWFHLAAWKYFLLEKMCVYIMLFIWHIRLRQKYYKTFIYAYVLDVVGEIHAADWLNFVENLKYKSGNMYTLSITLTYPLLGILINPTCLYAIFSV